MLPVPLAWDIFVRQKQFAPQPITPSLPPWECTMTALSGVQEKFSCFPSASAISAISISSNIILARYSSRFNFDIACNMDFHRSCISSAKNWRHYIFYVNICGGRFPVDEQYCQIKFESFGFTNKQVEKLNVPEIFYIFWRQIKLAWMDESQNNVNQNISLAQFGFKWEPIPLFSSQHKYLELIEQSEYYMSWEEVLSDKITCFLLCM